MKTILLIDDEPELLELLEYFFNRLNYNVSSFSNVVTIDKIQEIKPNLIILDYGLGAKTGGDLCRELKSHPSTQHIPVIIVSANPEVSLLWKDDCADAFLHKPFDIAELDRVVRNVQSLQAL